MLGFGMIRNRRPHAGHGFLLSALTSLLLSQAAPAAVIVTIQPSADLNDIVWTVSWDSLEGSDDNDIGSNALNRDWDAMDPATGAVATVDPWGAEVRTVNWFNVGDPFGPLYVDGWLSGFGDGAGGVVSSPSGWGVGPDDDSPAILADDFLIFNTLLDPTELFPTSGFFVLTVPGANLSNYNIGVHDRDPFVTITVTDTPFSSTVPEPGTLVLLGAALLGVGVLRRRR